MTTKALAGQTLLDIAIVTAGGIEALVDMAVVNGMAVTDDLRNGQKIVCTEVKKRNVVQLFTVSGQQPATAMTAEDEELLPGGIGYMAVGVDFVVS